ncbi:MULTISPECIES: hypothetical protein [Lactobacillaceae]|uniref:hypothetical protein n=1 Tax=Lactobacillaceae TaxID=33958 RepID=UPI0014568A10|nr:hypothetical protein [Lactobacillus sp. HBUAS51381]NLR09981.1 hypothetical protein [Lactobacillus sp. HBUAS51381]
MNKLKKTKQMRKKVIRDFNTTGESISDLSTTARGMDSFSNRLHNSEKILDSLDKQFMAATKLTKADISILMTATALQVVRQYFLSKINWTADKDERLDDKKAAGEHQYDRNNRETTRYRTTVLEINTNPVPFDTQNGSKSFGENLGGGKYHRLATLGHDPILGWVFGTANIATRTVTLANLHSYHVTYDLIGKRYGDMFSGIADTPTVLYRGLIHNVYPLDLNNFSILACSIVKEAIHLKSDIFSKQGLALPGVSLLNMDLSKKLCDYGVDMYNVMRIAEKAALQAALSLAINILISMVHRLFYKAENSENIELFKVRTHKILTYSNLLATGSNVIASSIMSATGNVSGGVQSLDIGGSLVSIGQLFYDSKFIGRVKEEFLKEGWANEIAGDKLIIPNRL